MPKNSHHESCNTNSQSSNEGEEAQKNGGYMRVLHSLEEKFYSAGLKVSGNSFKVLIYIKHNTIRWDAYSDHFSYGEISKATGISERQLKDIVKTLLKKKLITLEKKTVDGITFKNKIGLNTKFFGEILELKHRPKLTSIEGGKSHVRNSTPSAEISTGGGAEISTGGCQIQHPERGQEAHPELVRGDLNNLILNNSLKNVKNFQSFEEKEAKEKLKSMGLIKGFP